MVRILSIDGGGIRGIIPAIVLRDIERRLRRAGGKRPLAGIFDLIAGTSTGALIALGLALPRQATAGAAGRRTEDGNRRAAMSSAAIVRLYERRGQEVFPSHFYRRWTVQAVRHKYPPAGLERLLGETFGAATLKDALTNLLITSLDTEKMEPHCFKNRPDRPVWKDDLNFFMRDAARAATAAPTYFPPAHISPVPPNGKLYCLVDGGLFAGNPAMLAYHEATKIFPRDKNFLILSLGTGIVSTGYRYDEIHRWGYLEWVNPAKGFPLAAMMLAGQSEAVTHRLSRMAGVRYVRLNASLAGASLQMDDARPQNVESLKAIAARLIAENRQAIDHLCELL